MKKQLIMMVITLVLCNTVTFAQNRYFTRKAKVVFRSDTPLEKIVGTNTQGTNVFDSKSGQFEFAVLMKAFEFEQALLEEHFNENYMESDKYPKAVFKGTIVDVSKLDLMKDGIYPVKIKGTMTMHGVSKEMTTDGQFEVKGMRVTGKSNFLIACADYKIDIPALVRDKIAKEVKVSIETEYESMVPNQ